MYKQMKQTNEILDPGHKRFYVRYVND